MPNFTKGRSFTSTEELTNTKLHQLVEDASMNVTAITSLTAITDPVADTDTLPIADDSATAIRKVAASNFLKKNSSSVFDAGTTRITGVSAPSASSDATTKTYVDTNDALKVFKSGDTMSGDLNMGSNKVTSLGSPTASGDATTKAYVDTASALKVAKSGDTMSGDLNMGSNKISALSAPVLAGDAANKAYVDSIAVVAGNLPSVNSGNNGSLLQVKSGIWTTTASSLEFDLSGNVGIGTSSPAEKLEVASSAPKIKISATSNSSVQLLFNSNASGVQKDTGSIYYLNDESMTFRTASTERLRIDSSGNVGIGTNNPQGRFQSTVGTAPNAAQVVFGYLGASENYYDANLHSFRNGDSVERLRIDSSGNVGIGTTSPTSRLHLGSGDIRLENGNYILFGGTSNGISGNSALNVLSLYTNATERLRIDSGGNVGIGNTVASTIISAAGGANGSLVVGTGSGSPNLIIYGGASNYGSLYFADGTTGGDTFRGYVEYNHTDNFLRLGTNTSERLRIDSGGNVLFGKTTSDATIAGAWINPNGKGLFTSSADAPLYANRKTNDGALVEFLQDNSLEGTISVSGNTVSYNAFAGSHWSQLEDGSKPEILRGTVIESIDQLCEWHNEENERLPKCKISDTASSKKVYGVFLDWDNDWTDTNDLYVTSLGAFVCRINSSVTVQIGDLLESNGDGTARVQADDVIRSSTIGKVTSTVKTHEHQDGSYCVPTVLYCG